MHVACPHQNSEINDDVLDEIFEEEVLLDEFEEESLNITVAAVPKSNTEPTDSLDMPQWNVECMTKFENSLMESSWEQSGQKNVAEYYDSLGHAFSELPKSFPEVLSPIYPRS